MKHVILSLGLFLALQSFALAENLSQYLQDISVTVHSGTSSGSGVLISREVPLKKDSPEKVRVNFVWTAAHVVDNLRVVRDVIDPVSGQSKKVVEYRPAFLVKELVENGR